MRTRSDADAVSPRVTSAVWPVVWSNQKAVRIVASTVPVDGATDVTLTASVVVTFSEEMNATTVSYQCNPNPGGWNVVWSSGNTVATYTHTSFADSTQCHRAARGRLGGAAGRRAE